VDRAKEHSGCRKHCGRQLSVQANLVLNDNVWPAMVKPFQKNKGDLAERMLAALDAAQTVGGDIRGMQSAALIIVTGKPTGQPWEDRIFDLRVDDSAEPLKELRRLVTLQRAHNHRQAALLASRLGDKEAGLREDSAAQKLVPNDAETMYWTAVTLVQTGRINEALPVFPKGLRYGQELG
jgi:uncharacterized Ntn-hydrolase superfamily protein